MAFKVFKEKVSDNLIGDPKKKKNPCMWWVISLLLFSRLSLCFEILIKLCLSASVPEYFHSWLSSKLRTFQPLFCQSLCLFLSLFLLGLLQCICWSLRLCWLHSFSFCSSDLIISIVLTSSLLIFLSAQICFWVPWVNSSFQLLYCSDPESFWFLFILYWYFHFVQISFLDSVHVFL